MQKCKLWLILFSVTALSAAVFASVSTVHSAKTDNSRVYVPTTIDQHSTLPAMDAFVKGTNPLVLLAQNSVECSSPDVGPAPCQCNYGAGGPVTDSNGCNCLSGEVLPDGSCSTPGGGITLATTSGMTSSSAPVSRGVSPKSAPVSASGSSKGNSHSSPVAMPMGRGAVSRSR